MARAAAAKHWVFTYNNPTVDANEFQSIIMEEWKISYAIFQKEKGETGTVHYQGTLRFDNLDLAVRLCRVQRQDTLVRSEEAEERRDDPLGEAPWHQRSSS